MAKEKRKIVPAIPKFFNSGARVEKLKANITPPVSPKKKVIKSTSEEEFTEGVDEAPAGLAAPFEASVADKMTEEGAQLLCSVFKKPGVIID